VDGTGRGLYVWEVKGARRGWGERGRKGEIEKSVEREEDIYVKIKIKIKIKIKNDCDFDTTKKKRRGAQKRERRGGEARIARLSGVACQAVDRWVWMGRLRGCGEEAESHYARDCNM
jgi:hypothetical protein